MQINENFSLKNIGYYPISVDETETPEAGGAAWRLYPNDIRDKCIIAAKCDKNTNYLHISEKVVLSARPFPYGVGSLRNYVRILVRTTSISH